jgi:hypothetical protein
MTFYESIMFAKDFSNKIYSVYPGWRELYTNRFNPSIKVPSDSGERQNHPYLIQI